MEELLKEAEALAGREVEVEKTTNNDYVVLWFDWQAPPPPTGDTPEQAVRNFIAYMKKKENTDEDNDRDTAASGGGLPSGNEVAGDGRHSDSSVQQSGGSEVPAP